jgi:hypothetical protein
MPGRLILPLAAVVVLLVCPWCEAQRLTDRIDHYRQSQAAATRDAEVEVPQLNIPYRLRTFIDNVAIDEAAARDAFSWWSSTTHIPLVINWEALELEGIDPEQPVTLHLTNIPAGHLLSVLMQLISLDVELLFQSTPWYVEIITKRQANRRPVLRVYEVHDLTRTIPGFTDAPSVDLGAALSNTSSGGGGSQTSLFGDEDDADTEETKSKTERGDELADLIRQSIETDIWQLNGGESASIKYFNDRLIVSAPLYVQRQIGIPIAPPRIPVFNVDYNDESRSEHHTSVRKGISGIRSSPVRTSGKR